MSFVPLFTQHSRSWRDNRYVYPVISRRSKGLSVGVNLNPDKACNFDCIYCSVDRTIPSTLRDVDLGALTDELTHMADLVTSGDLFRQPPFDQTPERLRRWNDIALSGDGEPTAYPRFNDALNTISAIHESHDLHSVKIVLITNATLFHRPAVAEGLRFLDRHNGEIWAKLDAGTEEYYRTVERTAIPLARVLDNILFAGRERPIVIQSLFMNIHDTPPTAAEVDQYVQRLIDLRNGGCQIKLVQVYTVARDTAEKYVMPLNHSQVDAIAEQTRAAGFTVEGFYGPT